MGARQIAFHNKSYLKTKYRITLLSYNLSTGVQPLLAKAGLAQTFLYQIYVSLKLEFVSKFMVFYYVGINKNNFFSK